MKLRDYQRRAIQGVCDTLQSNTSALVVAPTGTGKTILFAEAARMAKKRVMVIAHREELLSQAAEKIEAVTGERPEIEQSILWSDESVFGKSKTIVASIQSLNARHYKGRRHERFNPDEFSLVIVDEAHHAVSTSYRRVLDWFRKFNPSCKILGFTATPDRTDKLALRAVFDAVAFDYNIKQAINDGWLTPIKNTIVSVDGLDFSTVRTTAGDLNKSDLAAVMEFEKVLHGIAVPTLDLIGEEQTLVFAASVKQAERLAEIFDRYKPGSAGFVSGKMESDRRRDVIARFRGGSLQILVNVGVATEGFDVPGVGCVAMARPTKSRSLYAQMVGRGTRPAPGIVDGPETPEKRREAIEGSNKPYCHVIDFAGNSGQHRLVHTTDILGGDDSEEVRDRAHEIIDNGVTSDVAEAIEIAKVEIEEEELKEKSRRSHVRADSVKYQTNTVDPFQAMGVKRDSARFMPHAGGLTGNQLSMLSRSGVNPEHYSPQEQRLLHRELIRRIKTKRCSLKQAQVLSKYGFNTTKMSFKEASGLIDRLAKNNWKPMAG
jgi:superfamily II DNA or RNA helicase